MDILELSAARRQCNVKGGRPWVRTEIHPHAMAAAIVAEYAGSHGKFWQAHDALYEHQQQLGDALYLDIAKSLNLPLDGLRAAFDSSTIATRIQDDLDGGIRSGVNGTPAFFINGQLYNVRGGFDDLANPVAELIERAGR